jgi:hypothetical protein
MRALRIDCVGLAVVGIVAVLGGGLAGALTGCADQPYDPAAPAIDPNAPRIHITAPALGTFAGDVTHVLVVGTASDDTRVASVQVNGVDAALASDGGWTAMIPVAPGTQLIHAVARDGDGNTGKESRAVVVGAMRSIATAVPQAITAAISAQTFDALGRGVAGYLQAGQLAAAIASDNPVIDVGHGPDCLYAQGSVTRASVGAATTVALVPEDGGLALDVELDQVVVGMHLDYAVACLDGARDIAIAARHIQITGALRAGIADGGFDVALADPRVAVTGFDVDLGGVPGEIADALHLDAALGPILAVATERLVVPLVNRSLGALNQVNTVAVLGTEVDFTLAPARIAFDAGGAIIELDSSLRARGDAGSPGYVYTANQLPEPSQPSLPSQPSQPSGASTLARGFELAIADDAVNQLLASAWAAGSLTRVFDLTTGSYGALGTLYDRVELAAKVPPFIAASGGTLTLTLGDLVATFKDGSATATQVAINAAIEVTVVTGSDGAPRLDVGSPTAFVDVIDDHIDGANALSNAQFEAIASFALGRVLAVGSGFVGAVPLPALGGVAVRTVEIAEQTGYLVVTGYVQ